MDGSLQHLDGTADGKLPKQAQLLLKYWCVVMEVRTISRHGGAGGVGEGRRAYLGLAAITGKANA